MNNFGIRLAAAAVACCALSLSACGAEESAKDKPAAAPAAKAAEPAAKVAEPAAAPAAKAAESVPAPAAKAAEPAAPAAKAAAPAAAAPAAADAGANAAASPESAEVREFSKTLDEVAFKDTRYRNKAGNPVPVVTKDYKVDWATWQGFRRYHDACHVCHGPNALGSSFAPSLAESLKTMDYETFYGTVVGGRVADRGGTKYVMPAFGEDRNIMCYLDDIYTYIKARSNNMVDPKTGMPAGRPNGREDISPEAKKAASDCTG